MKPKEIWDTPINEPAETHREYFYGMGPDPQDDEEDFMDDVSDEDTHTLLSSDYKHNRVEHIALPGPKELKKLLPPTKGKDND